MWVLSWDDFETFTMVMGWAAIVYFYNFTETPETIWIADEYAKFAEAVKKLNNPNLLVAAYDSEWNPPPNCLVFTEMHNLASPPHVIIFPMYNKTLPLPFILPEHLDYELLMMAMDKFGGTDMISKWKEK